MAYGIIEQVVGIEKVNKHPATHFALCNGEQIRYLIDLKGKKRLSQNLSTYSGKLGILTKTLPVTPFSVLSAGGMGNYVKCELRSEAERKVRELNKRHWNMIVGTYGPQQKVVLQCFDEDERAIFLKIGNAATAYEMKNETAFLKRRVKFNSFHIPELIDVDSEGGELVFQATKEFSGDKVEPVLTEEIVKIYREIASVESDDGREFSHGDFAPWNMKRDGDSYIVFDWEFCGLRTKGFDLMHFIYSIKTRLEGKNEDAAFAEGLAEIRKYIPAFVVDRSRFENEYRALRG